MVTFLTATAPDFLKLEVTQQVPERKAATRYPQGRPGRSLPISVTIDLDVIDPSSIGAPLRSEEGGRALEGLLHREGEAA